MLDMKIASRFTVAVHTLLAVRFFGNDYKTTSEFIASSVRVNPVVIRRTLGALKAAGLVEVAAGSGGARLARDPADITLLEIYRAVGCAEDTLFHFHENPNPACPVGRNVRAVLSPHLADAQTAMERELQGVTLQNLLDELAPLAGN